MRQQYTENFWVLEVVYAGQKMYLTEDYMHWLDHTDQKTEPPDMLAADIRAARKWRKEPGDSWRLSEPNLMTLFGDIAGAEGKRGTPVDKPTRTDLSKVSDYKLRKIRQEINFVEKKP